VGPVNESPTNYDMHAMKNIFSVFLHNNKHIFNATGRLLPESIFWLLLQRERFLADRGGRVFAVLVFDLNRLHEPERLQSKLKDAVVARLRCSDAAGWIDNTRIGALLAQSHIDDARRMADEICAHLGLFQEQSLYKIYTYPADHLGDDAPGDELVRKHPRAVSVDAPASPNLVTDAARIYSLFAPPFPRWKRAMDILGALLLLVLLSPLLAGTGLYIN